MFHWSRPHLEWIELDLGRSEAVPAGPNVVLVIGCTVRPDQTSLVRGDLQTTPFLAQWAQTGTRFTDPITAAPWTRAAAVALLTGHHAVSVGMTEPDSGRNRQALSTEIPTLASLFSQAGWRTLGATGNPNLNSQFGMNQGFEAYLQPRMLWSEAGGIKVPGAELVDGLMARLDAGADGRPVFVQVAFVDAHAPHPDAGLMQPGDVPQLPEEVLRYRVSLRQFDDSLSRLVSALKTRGLTPDNTLFAVVNDHGEGLSFPPEHGPGHGRLLAPTTVGGLWVLVGRGVPADQRIGGLASQVDVAPTLLALAGIPGPAVPGHDLSDSVRSGVPTGRSRAWSDTWFLSADRAAVYTEGWACTQSFADDEEGDCFHRGLDPMHLRPSTDDALLEALGTWRKDREAERDQYQGAVTIEVSEEMNQQLEALGYLDP
jgi:arylsulfatase A-like enzyme